MTAAVLRFSELHMLSRKMLIALAIQTAAEVDAGADKRALLERIIRAVMDKPVVVMEKHQ